MLVGAFEIHHRIGAAINSAVDAGKTWEMLGIVEAECMCRT